MSFIFVGIRHDSGGKPTFEVRNRRSSLLGKCSAVNQSCHLLSQDYRRFQMFSGLKDSLSSTAAKSLLASRIDRYGKLTDLRIRSREKTISVELLLEGEEIPVTLRVERYRITGTSGEHSLVVEAVSASRPWLQNLLEDLLIEKPLRVPSILLLALGKSAD